MSQPTPPYDPSTPGEQPGGAPQTGQPDPYGQNAQFNQGQPYGQSSPYGQSGPYGQSAPYGEAPAYGQPPTGQYGQPYAVSRPNNSMALVSLIAGIAGLTLLPGIGSIVAVITGHMARREIERTGEEGRSLATGGLILGWIGVGLIVLTIVGFIIFFGFLATVGATTNGFE